MGKIKDDPIWSKVIATAICTFIGSLILYLIPGGWPWVFSKMGALFKWLWAWLFSPATIPTWFLCVLCVISALAIIIAILAAIYGLSVSRDDPLGLSKRGEFSFYAIKFFYKYDGQTAKILSQRCLTCDFEIHPRDTGGKYRHLEFTFVCENCNKTLFVHSGPLDEFYGLVERHIELEQRKLGQG